MSIDCESDVVYCKTCNAIILLKEALALKELPCKNCGNFTGTKINQTYIVGSDWHKQQRQEYEEHQSERLELPEYMRIPPLWQK